jgi:hypothetical protein
VYARSNCVGHAQDATMLLKNALRMIHGRCLKLGENGPFVQKVARNTNLGSLCTNPEKMSNILKTQPDLSVP